MGLPSRTRARRLATLAGAALCATTLSATGAEAKSFYLSPAGKDSWLVIDPLTAESQPGGVVRRMWSVTVQRSIVDAGPPQPGYVRTQTDYDCLNKQVHWRTFSAYSRSGALLVTRDNINPAWTPATSAPDIYAAFRVACEGAFSSAVSAESIGRLVITLMASWDPPETAAPAQQPLLPAPAKPAAGAKAATPGPAAPKPAAAKPAATPPPAGPARPWPKAT
jgi:hypothetical protein